MLMLLYKLLDGNLDFIISTFIFLYTSKLKIFLGINNKIKIKKNRLKNETLNIILCSYANVLGKISNFFL